ncbi:MAG TPA: hypothetical protein VGH99_15385 [Pseudonocardia sp.]
MSPLWPAQDPPTPPQGPEFGGSSPVGLVVTLFLLAALVLLMRSMSKHLKKVPPSFDEPERTEGSADGRSGGGTPGGAPADETRAATDHTAEPGAPPRGTREPGPAGTGTPPTE